MAIVSCASFIWVFNVLISFVIRVILFWVLAILFSSWAFWFWSLSRSPRARFKSFCKLFKFAWFLAIYCETVVSFFWRSAAWFLLSAIVFLVFSIASKSCFLAFSASIILYCADLCSVIALFNEASKFGRSDLAALMFALNCSMISNKFAIALLVVKVF